MTYSQNKRYKISKRAGDGDRALRVPTLLERHQVFHFVPALTKFLKDLGQNVIVDDSDRFDTFNRFSVVLPKLYHMPEEDEAKRKDRIRARPARCARRKEKSDACRIRHCSRLAQQQHPTLRDRARKHLI